MPRPDTENFVKDWVAQNVRSVPGLASLSLEVDRLAAGLTSAARAEGISGSDIHRAFGNIDDYLMAQYQQTCASQPSS